MKFPQIEIDMDKLYKWGFYLLSIGAVANFITFTQQLYTLQFQYVTQIIGGFASSAFSFLLAGFFYYMYQGTKPAMPDNDFQKEFKTEETKNGSA